MQEEIEREIARLGGRAACVVVSLEPGGPRTIVAIQPRMAFPAASLAKVPILVEVARQVAAGELSWETRLSVPASAQVSSDGVLAALSPELRPTLHDLAHLMIIISDNTASNILLDLVGMEAINDTMLRLGLASTRLERRFLDFTARKEGRDNWTTAEDMARLFTLLCTENISDRERLLQILLRQNDYTILPAYWGEDIPFAHKTGGLEGVIHDAGILYPPLNPQTAPPSGRHPLILAVLTADQEDVPFARYVLARIGKSLFKEMG